MTKTFPHPVVCQHFHVPREPRITLGTQLVTLATMYMHVTLKQVLAAERFTALKFTNLIDRTRPILYFF